MTPRRLGSGALYLNECRCDDYGILSQAMEGTSSGARRAMLTDEAIFRRNWEACLGTCW